MDAEDYAMALNEEDHRLFTVTRKTPMLVVLDTQTGNECAAARGGRVRRRLLRRFPANAFTLSAVKHHQREPAARSRPL